MHSQQDQAPEFQKVKKQPVNEYKGKVNVKTTIVQGNTEKSKRVIDYYLSSITLKGNIEFSNNIAFGAGISTRSGSAIFTSYTALSVATDSNLKVHQNTATVGGGLCHIASAVYLEKSNIFSNSAFRYGGGIYFQGEHSLSPDIKLICNGECNIHSNTALEYGGGICFSTAKEAYFDNSKIYSNIASFAG